MDTREIGMVWNITSYEVAYRALRRSTAVASAAWSRMDCRIQRTNLTLLGGPPRLQNQGREELARRRAFLGRRFSPLGPALILRLVGHAVLGLERLLIEQEQIVRDRHQLRLRLLGHQARRPSLLLPQFVLDLVEHLFRFPSYGGTTPRSPRAAGPFRWSGTR